MQRRWSMAALAAVAILVLACAQASAQKEPESPKWLGQPLHNWNIPGGAIPKAPLSASDGPENCKESIREPAGPEDRAVIAAGWFLTGAQQVFSGTSVILAESGVDGMCRPVGYQVFVFVNGKFAGTISPVPMNSREDGSTGPVELFRANDFTISFNRYAKTDPLCCPSKQTSVSYKIETVKGRPVLVPYDKTEPESPSNQ